MSLDLTHAVGQAVVANQVADPELQADNSRMADDNSKRTDHSWRYKAAAGLQWWVSCRGQQDTKARKPTWHQSE